MLAFITWTWVAWTFISLGLSFAIQYLLRQEPKKLKPDAFQTPEVREGTKYTILFGTNWIENPVVDWWGDYKVVAIKEKYYSGFNKKHRTVGFYFYIGVNFRVCQGVTDGFKQIRFGEAVGWPDSSDKTALQADGAAVAAIDEPNLFGGYPDGEGGIRGNIDLLYGGAVQTTNSYLVGQLGSNISANRGFTSAVFKQIYCGTSPYLKSPKFLIKRTDTLTSGATQWYPSKAEPTTGTLNPAHIIRECMTDTVWGLGYHTNYFDATLWEGVADVLYTEGFGLSMKWEGDSGSLEDFIQDVLRHIDAKLYQDLETGEIVLKLVRDDYSVPALDSFDETDVTITKFTQMSPHEVPTTIWLEYWSTIDNKPIHISDDDIALMSVQGSKSVPLEVDYHGVTVDSLASKLAARDRKALSTFPVTMTLRCKRTMAHLRPGDVFDLAYAPFGITQVILRVNKVDFGSLSDGHVTIECVTDVFALENGLYAATPATGWSDPRSNPADVDEYKLIEAPYLELALANGETAATASDEDTDYLLCIAAAPTGDSLDYALQMRVSPSSSFLQDGTGYFTPHGYLVSAMPTNAVDVVATLYNDIGLDDILVDTYAMIDNEVLKVKAVDVANSQVTLARGCLDTIPESHDGQAASGGGAVVWFSGYIRYMASYEFSVNDTPGVRFLTRTAKGSLAEGSATIRTATAFNRRQTRPYPPGDFKINSVSYPSTFSGQPTISWAHRDRTQQVTNDIVEHSDSSIGPEAGVTYTLTIHDENDVLCREVSGLTGTSYTYQQADELSDCGLASAGELNSKLRFKLKSVRPGLQSNDEWDSWQEYDIWVDRV